MLLIASETIRADRAVRDVIREMSFTPSFFASPGTFAELMNGQSRRIVLLTEDDVCTETVRTLRAARDRAPFGVIVTANRASLRGVKEAELVEKLASYDNIEWVGKDFDFDKPHPNSALANSLGLNRIKSSADSPTPRYMTGMRKSLATAAATPPFAVPSIFASKTPSTLTAFVNSRA